MVFFPFLSSVAGVAWRSPGVAWHQATPSYARQQREQPKGSFGLLVAVDRMRNGNKKSVMVVVIISVCFNTRNVDTIAKKILHTVTLVTLLYCVSYANSLRLTNLTIVRGPGGLVGARRWPGPHPKIYFFLTKKFWVCAHMVNVLNFSFALRTLSIYFRIFFWPRSTPRALFFRVTWGYFSTTNM